MRTIKKLTLVLSVAALSCASAHGMFRGIGNAVGNVMSQSGRMTTNTLDYATQAPGRLAGIQTSSGLVHRPGQGSTEILRRPGQGGTGIWRVVRKPAKKRVVKRKATKKRVMRTLPYKATKKRVMRTLPYFGE